MKTLTIVCLPLMVLMLSSACGPLITPAPMMKIQDYAYQMAWSPDDHWLAASTNAGLYLIDAKTYQQQAFFPDAKYAEVVFGRNLMASNDGEMVRVWDLQKDQLLWVQHAAPIRFQSIALSRDDRFLATGEEKHFRVWSMPDGTVMDNVPVTGFVSNVAFTNDDSLIAITQYQALIQTWDVNNEKLIRHFEIPRDVVFFTLSQDGTTLLVDYNDPGFERWDVLTGKPQHYYRGAISAAGWERLSANNRFAVVWGHGLEGQGSGMSVWELSSDRKVREFATPIVNGDGWRGAALNSDGSVLAASNNQGLIYFYNVASGVKMGQFSLPDAFVPVR